MNSFAVSNCLRRCQLPTGILVVLLQRTPAPVVRALVQWEEVIVDRAPLLLRSGVVAAAMGAYNSVAGATVFNVTPATPSSGPANSTFTVTGTTGTALSVSISVSGAPGNPKSWSVKNTTPLPAGLSVVGGNPVNVVAPYKMTISGTPSAVGSTACTVTAWDGLNGTGGNSAKITVTFNISSGVVNTPPSITSQPASQTVTVGNSVTFTVAANGSPAPTYQWNKDGVPIGGATSTSYVIGSVANGDAGVYTAVATNVAGTATSNGATLTVQAAPPPNTAPSFTTQPLSQTVTAGNPVTFTASASGNPAPTYQWNKGGVPISGATGQTYTIAATVSGDAGTYTAVATNSVGSATSAGATLTVQSAPPPTTPPSITTQPVSQSVSTGGSVTFTVAASGTPAPTFQWRKDGVAISGATNTSYTIAAAAGGDAGTYTAVATNSAGTATSNGATLTVLAPPPPNTAPSITMQPTSQTVTAGLSVTFSVAASGNPAPTYQWKKDGVTIGGATSAAYTIASAATTDAGTYTVLVSNSAGNVTSSGAVLIVGAAPPPPPPVTTSFFSFPSGIAFVGPDGLFVADSSADTIQKVTTAGDVTLFAGTSGSAGSNNGTGAGALFSQPGGVAATSGGILFVADTANAMIRRIAADGSVTTFAGSSTVRGNADGTGTAATFSSPVGVAVDGAGNLYVADAMSQTIRKITPAGVVSTLAGSPATPGFADGTGAAALFNHPAGVAVDGAGNVYVADQSNNIIRKITPAGVVTTLAGLQGVSGTDDGTGSLALFNQPGGVVLDAAGNLFVADTANNSIRKITPAGAVTTLAGLPTIGGNQDGTGSGAMFNQPRALTIDSGGNLYVADTGNASIRKVTPAGVVTTLSLRQGSTSGSTGGSTTGGGTSGGGSTATGGPNGNGAGSMEGWFVAVAGLLVFFRWYVRRSG